MSCLNPNYNPDPTHVGYRVENRCVLDTEYTYSTTSQVYIPSLQINVPIVSVPYVKQMLEKGNVLQYKKNSSNLTNKQRYSQICKGLWTNRTKTFATQTQTYTNPNIRSFKKENVPVNITLSGNPTNDPITCDTTSNNTYPLSPLLVNNNPQVLNNVVVNDGGNLVCNTIENPCNGVSATFPTKYCYPSTASNIPLPEIQLCYNTNLPTYYPKTRYVMNTSLSKWPQNAKGLCKSANSISSTNCNL
jgi:hypothetical protein